MKKIISLTLSLALSLTVLAGCGKNDPVVMNFYGEDFTASEYAYALKVAYSTISDEFDSFQDTLKEEFAEENADDPTAIFVRDVFIAENYYDQASSAAIETLRDIAVTRHMLTINGFEIEKEDKASAQSLLEYYQQPYMYGGIQAYKEYMRSDGRTVSAWTLEQEYTYAYDRMLPFVYGNATLSDEDLYKAYEDEFYNAAHVLLMKVEADDETGVTQEDADAENAIILAEANEILAEVLAGADIFDLIASVPSADSGQPEDGYAFLDGGMITVFNDAVLSIEAGEIYPEVVESSFGYHVIQRLLPNENIFNNYIDDVKSGNSYSLGSDAHDALTDDGSTPTFTEFFYEIDGSNYLDYIIID